jgi:hypothetical protein
LAKHGSESSKGVDLLTRSPEVSTVEDEIGPRGPGRGTTVEGDQQIDLETFYSQFIRPERGTATVAAQANDAAAEARLSSLLASIENNRHGPGAGK